MPLILRIHTYRKQAPVTPVEKSFDPLGGTIGRGPNNDLVLLDESKFISRTHCKVDFRDGSYFLTDLGSNPSLVNQRPVGNGKQVRLSHADVVDIGEYQLQVVVTDGAAAATPATMPQLDTLPAATAPVNQYGAQPLFGNTPPAATNMFDPLAGAKILDVGAGLGGHVGADHDPLGLNVGTGPVQDPFADPLFGRSSQPQGGFRGSEQDHVPAQHMAMPSIAPLPDDFLAPAPAPAYLPSPPPPIAAIRPVQAFIPDDFDLLAPAPAYAPAPAPAPLSAPAFDPLADPMAAPPLAAPVLPAAFDPLAPAALPSAVTGVASNVAADFDPLGATPVGLGANFDPLGAATPAAPLAAPTRVSAPAADSLGRNFDPLAGATPALAAGFDPLAAAPPAASSLAQMAPIAPPVSSLTPLTPIAPIAPITPPTPQPPAAAVSPVTATAFAPIPSPRAAPPAASAAHASASDSEVMQALLRGLGMPDLKSKLSETELAELVGRMLKEAVDGTMGVLKARQITKRETRVEMTMIASHGNNPLKIFPDPEQAMNQMLTNAWAGYMPGVKAMNNAFDDLCAHELATIAGMRAALKGVLLRFDPAAIEARLDEPTVMDKMMASKRKAKMWDRMVDLYGQMSNEAEDDFQRLFGEKFASAYEEQTERMRQSKKT